MPFNRPTLSALIDRAILPISNVISQPGHITTFGAIVWQ